MALVNQGEVVVAPFSEQCSAAGIGPCSFNALELDDQAMQVIEFNSDMAMPQLVPIVALGPESNLYEAFSQNAALIAGAGQQEIEETALRLVLQMTFPPRAKVPRLRKSRWSQKP